MASPISTAEKIAQAINYEFGSHLVLSCNKFFGREGWMVKMWIVKDSFYDGHTYVDEELFRTTSGTYACLFCRDLLFHLQDKPIPAPPNQGYANVLERREAVKSMDYMKKVYGQHSFCSKSQE